MTLEVKFTGMARKEGEEPSASTTGGIEQRISMS